MNASASIKLQGNISPGTAAGIEHHVNRGEAPAPVKLRVFDYSRDKLEARTFADLESIFEAPQPDWAEVRWIDVEESDALTVDAFRKHYGFHTLAAEDVLHLPQRPRVERYEDHLFITARMVGLDPEGKLTVEQVTMFLYDNLLITFQQFAGDPFDPIRARLKQEGSRLRQGDAGFLAYSLLDAIVDFCFPLMERYSDRLEEIEDETMAACTPQVLQRIHIVKRDITTLRRIVWPTRELIDQLMQEEDRLSPSTRVYLRDVLIHVTQLLDILEASKETAATLVELYMSVMSHRMNEVMKVLTVIATIFIPITFLAGVYGMNFKHFPELDERWAYPTFWAVCVVVSGALLIWFRRKQWL